MKTIACPKYARVGELVRITSDCRMRGKEGVVVVIVGNKVGVEFDRVIANCYGYCHTCNGVIPYARGRWFKQREVEVVG